MKTESDFRALMVEFDAIEDALPGAEYLGLHDTNCIEQNVMDGNPNKPVRGSDEYWDAMCSAAKMFAGMLAENQGKDINALIGRVIY
jgi:hypothetical protein